MATLETAIKTWLLTQSAITAYVGSDVYHAARPEGLETDYICYEIIYPSNNPYCFGTTNTAQPVVQFDIFSKNDTSCHTIGNALVTALMFFEGTLDTGLNVISTLDTKGPMVTRDRSDEQWFHGIVEWQPEYER